MRRGPDRNTSVAIQIRMRIGKVASRYSSPARTMMTDSAWTKIRMATGRLATHRSRMLVENAWFKALRFPYAIRANECKVDISRICGTQFSVANGLHATL